MNAKTKCGEATGLWVMRLFAIAWPKCGDGPYAGVADLGNQIVILPKYRRNRLSKKELCRASPFFSGIVSE